MKTQSKFWQRVYGWGLLPGLMLLWLLTFIPGHSLAQTPTPTATPSPRPRKDLLRARVDTQTVAAAAATQLQAQSDGALRVDYNPTTGAARWVATEGMALTHEFAGRNLSPEAAARSFLGAYGRLFGVADQAAELQLRQLKRDDLGGQHVTFQQQQGGINVFGADLKVHLDGTGAVKLINGYTLPTARGLSLTPTLSPDQAAQAAVRTTGLADGIVSSNTLVILNPGLITDQASPTYLTYQVRVDSAAQPDAAVWLFIDAATGEVRFSYPAVTDARNRNTYNVQHGTSGGSLARGETDPAVTSAPNCSVNDINQAHDYAGQTYDFYFTRFGRDSYDGAGAALNSYVCYGTNYQNAFWDGSKMVYGDGFVLDDVVGHELSHAVTQYLSGLIYSGQSGALNESFSDIMGEALDLTNNSGNDAAAVRWDMGEELPNIGAIRDMMDPTRFGNPERTDGNYYDCINQDVHINSGVQNKAFALMVDGGAFNGYTIAPVGLDKAVAVIYRANDLYLTSSAKFLDAYNAINQSCTELYGAGSADCTNVKLALDATRMSGPVCRVGGATPTPDPAAPTVANVVNGDFEAGRNVGWSETDNRNQPLVNTSDAETGNWKAWLVGLNNNTSAITQSYTVPATGGTLAYSYKIESTDKCNYDFAYVEVNTTVLKTYSLCTTTATAGYVAGSVSLTPYAGQTITLGFRAKTDSSVESSFYVDNVGMIGFSPTATPTNTRVPPTPTPTNTPVPPTPTPTNTPVPPTPTPTPTPALMAVDAGGTYTALALDSTGKPVISYYDPISQDLKLVKCGNATCNTGNTVVTLDSIGDVGWQPSIRIDSSGRPVVSYYDYTNGDLKLVYCGNATCNSGNTVRVVDNIGNAGQFSSLVLDSSGYPVISYWDLPNRILRLLRCRNATCTSTTMQPVQSTGWFGQYTSLALNSSGNPVISYWDESNADLKLVSCGDATCKAGSSFQSLDMSGFVGMFTSLALDSSGKPVVSYYDDTNGDLKLVYCGNATCSAGNIIRALDGAAAVGKYTSLALNSSGRPVISYQDVTNRDLKLIQCGDATCSSGNLIRTVDSAGDVGMSTALKLDSSGNAVISYYDLTNKRLKLARVLAPVAGGVAASAAADIEVSEVVLTQSLTTTSVVAAPAVVETVGQPQRLFLPLVANNGTLAASDGRSVPPVSETAPQSAAVEATTATTLTLTAADPNAVITTSAPVSVPVAVEAAPVVTESAPVSIPVVASASVVTASAVVSAPVAVTAPVVADTPAVTTTKPLTPADASVAAGDANAAGAPDANAQNQQLFLPVVTNLAGAALGSPGAVAGVVVVIVVVGGLVWRSRWSRRNR